MPSKVQLDIGQRIESSHGTWYQNLQFLGAGGNAETYLVIATSGQTKGVPFAIKLFHKFSKPERRDSFLQETAFLEECEHPAIMRTFDSGVYLENHPFLVAEYLPLTLDKVIRAGTVTIVQKLSYAIQLLSALRYLSTLDPAVVHRDIKPKNIFIKGESCVLGDFGLLKRVKDEGKEDQTIFKESHGVGMPYRYRTPDLVSYLNGESSLTPRSDVYQVGLVLAELFTGVIPQKESRDFSTPVEPYKVRSFPGKLSAEVLNLIEGMLVANPTERGDAADFLDPWQGVFFSAARQSHDLEGKVF